MSNTLATVHEILTTRSSSAWPPIHHLSIACRERFTLFSMANTSAYCKSLRLLDYLPRSVDVHFWKAFETHDWSCFDNLEALDLRFAFMGKNFADYHGVGGKTTKMTRTVRLTPGSCYPDILTISRYLPVPSDLAECLLKIVGPSCPFEIVVESSKNAPYSTDRSRLASGRVVPQTLNEYTKREMAKILRKRNGPPGWRHLRASSGNALTIANEVRVQSDKTDLSTMRPSFPTQLGTIPSRWIRKLHAEQLKGYMWFATLALFKDVGRTGYSYYVLLV
jgi:hypothetical protein